MVMKSPSLKRAQRDGDVIPRNPSDGAGDKYGGRSSRASRQHRHAKSSSPPSAPTDQRVEIHGQGRTPFVTLTSLAERARPVPAPVITAPSATSRDSAGRQSAPDQ